MFKSIRWTLQLWHAGLLALVLLGFGTASYFNISRWRYEQVDIDLERSVQVLAAGFQIPPPQEPPLKKWLTGRSFMELLQHILNGHAIGPVEPPNAATRKTPMSMDRKNSPPSENGLTEWFVRERKNLRFEVPAQLAQRIGDPATGMAYYVIWDSDEQIIKTSCSTPDISYPGIRPAIPWRPSAPKPPTIRQRGDWREAWMYGPFGTRLLFGKSMNQERSEMRHLALLLSLTGVGVLIVGLVGGGLLSRRAVQPIEAITNVAQEISASNLSRRIDVASTKSELGQLAVVLNDTFARLEAAFQQQIRFTADASHELRTPLSVIYTHAQLALTRDRSAEEYRKTIETCLRASGRMKGLVDSLLLLARADAGELTLDRKSVDLANIVEECITLIKPLAETKNVSIQTHLQPAKLNADPSRIAQVATNLLTNAIRYNHEKGSVRVHVESDGPCAVLMIADTGVGIPAESQPHLFERFYRVDKARSREDGGSGLGLAICKRIVEAHGGSIGFHSELGKGTTFIVRFPMTGTEKLTWSRASLP